ncbi:MAG: ZIP family metal transporter [Candidatus Kerfeldbacteria bacterium]
MNNVFVFALSASIIASVGGLAGGLLLLARERVARMLSRVLIGFSAGILLGVTFFDLLPEALAGFSETRAAFGYVMLGILVFFVIERIIASVHSHEHAVDDDDSANAETLRRSVPLVVFGDTVHNFIDGITVAVTFVASIPLGMATATSVLVHELPHEIADFTILIRSGMSRKKVFLVNFISALVAPLGTVIAYFFATNIEGLFAPLLAIAAGNLLYIAMSDLLPHLFHERDRIKIVIQVFMLLLGAGILFFIPMH